MLCTLFMSLPYIISPSRTNFYKHYDSKSIPNAIPNPTFADKRRFPRHCKTEFLPLKL
ncbi:hypothetical protein HMPREF1863_00120 [Aedoeadaptatus coxii]|uniref:Uncharacterized protein n=1 Tax=Aedoeadaptatus coxii TaxID=755172 RepID=A0A134AL08_9FIRM|nr:hypothetical protein HMPREF1863_00120 [Peptoniphilus coxii]